MCVCPQMESVERCLLELETLVGRLTALEETVAAQQTAPHSAAPCRPESELSRSGRQSELPAERDSCPRHWEDAVLPGRSDCGAAVTGDEPDGGGRLRVPSSRSDTDSRSSDVPGLESWPSSASLDRELDGQEGRDGVTQSVGDQTEAAVVSESPAPDAAGSLGRACDSVDSGRGLSGALDSDRGVSGALDSERRLMSDSPEADSALLSSGPVPDSGMSADCQDSHGKLLSDGQDGKHSSLSGAQDKNISPPPGDPDPDTGQLSEVPDTGQELSEAPDTGQHLSGSPDSDDRLVSPVLNGQEVQQAPDSLLGDLAGLRRRLTTLKDRRLHPVQVGRTEPPRDQGRQRLGRKVVKLWRGVALVVKLDGWTKTTC